MNAIEINVKISADKSLLDLVNAFAGVISAAKVAAPEQVQAEQVEEQPVVAPVVEQPKAAEQPKVEEAQKEYTEVDVRAAMDRTRQRIEGEDYKQKTDSEGYKKWHRALTAWFKQTAAELGADKPSQLPTSETRANFIHQCDEVEVINDKLQPRIPF